MRFWVLLAAVTGGAALAAVSATASPRSVFLQPSQPIEIAVVLDGGAGYTAGVDNAVRMAVSQSPPIAGHSIQLDEYRVACTGDISDVTDGIATAQAITADPNIVAVVGHPCSFAFGGVPAAPASGPCPPPVGPSALSLYESAGIPTINGSTTNRCLPPVGPTVFNTTAVADPGFDSWYASVQSQPPDRDWSRMYVRMFGSAPTQFADLYFDATNVLLARIRQVARPAPGILIGDGDLAAAIRNTVDFHGVTCTVTIDPLTGARVEQPVTGPGGCPGAVLNR